jgi:protein-histidine N-methyltransferase
VIVDWLAQNGARLGRLDLANEGDTGRGVRARTDIEAGERVLEVPRACLITTETARASAVGRALAAGAAGTEPPSAHTVLAACLLHERDDPRSFWRPYLDALPSSFPSVPLFYGDGELALLRGSYLPDKIASRKASLRRDHEALRRVPALARFSYEDFVWARFVVCSRVFGVVIAGKKTQAMVPMADMLNHRPSPEVRWAFSDALDAFVMIASRDVRGGDPVHDSYGHKCNGRFLLSYGFVLDDNEDNEAAVRLTLPRGASGLDAKVRMLGGLGCTFLVSARPDSETTRPALSFLRIAHANEAELRLAAGAKGARLGARNEAEALRALGAACDEALGRFPSTEEEDDALLAGGGLGPAARSCVVMRRGEKQVLRRLRAAAVNERP